MTTNVETALKNAPLNVALDQIGAFLRENDVPYKIWRPADIKAEHPELTDEQVEAATNTREWHMLSDCTDNDWELVDMAADAALENAK